MSLHSLANHLQSAGRGEDKVLVHMTPKEVNGLQSLAMAHGGSLTVNPETGLPEAGFLSSLLPMLAGGALTVMSGGAINPLTAGFLVGGGTAAATGSLKKGLMAGLGAYSGAGLGAGLQAMANPAAAGGQGLTVTDAGVRLQDTGAGVGLRAPEAISTTGVDMANAGFKNPVLNAGFKNPVLNAPVPTVAPANAAEFMNKTNQSILGKLPNAGNLPVATGGPRPFPADFPTGNSVVPTVDTVPAPRPDTYFTPRDSSGVIRGASGQAGKPITTISDTGGAHSGSYRDVPDNVLLQSNQPVLDVARTSPLDAVPVDASVARSLSGTPPAGSGPYDMAPIKNVVPRGGTVIAKDLPPIELKTNAVPAERHTLLDKPVNYRKSEIIVDPTMTEPASITQYTRPFTDRMAELGRGAKNVYAGGMQGLKDLYAATEVAAPYATYAGLGSTAYSMYDEKRQRMEDEARARAEASRGLIRPYEFSYGTGTGNVSSEPYYGSAERTYFRPSYTELPSYKAPGPEYAAKGGLMGLAVGGAVEDMAAQNAVGANTGYPMANLQTPMYSNPMMQRPEARNVIAPSADAGVGTYTGEPRFAGGGAAQGKSITYWGEGGADGRGGAKREPTGGYSYTYDPKTMQFTQVGVPQVAGQSISAKDSGSKISGGIATPITQPAAPAQSFTPNIDIPAYQTPEQQLGLGGFYDYMNQQLGSYGGYAVGGNVGGISHLGDYSDGGRLLKGPGDGVSDSIPASIGNRQPARLADGEFVVPARIVSEIGNGSTEAGARKLYAMMDRVQRARRKTVGKGQVARNTKAEKLLPA